MPKERFKLTPAVYLLPRRGDEVLLIRRYNTGYADGRYSLISGHVEADELVTDAMVREAREEGGVIIDPRALHFVHCMQRLNRHDGAAQERIDLFFVVDDWEGTFRNMEPDKCDDIGWFPVNRLPSNTLSVVRLAVGHVQRGVFYSEYTDLDIDD